MADNPIKGVSGPGKFSVRTDLPASQNYGDRQAMAEQIAGAPTARTPDVRGIPAGQVQAAPARSVIREPEPPDQARSPGRPSHALHQNAQWLYFL